MKRFRHPFFALLLSLLLIGSQQAAFAHLLTHIPGRSTAVTHYQSEHAIDGLADACTACIAFAGVGSGAPPASLAITTASFSGDSYCLPLAAPVFTRLVITCRARAPPAVHSL
jgi:hypothetical protein